MCFLAICMLKTLSLRVVCYTSINDQNTCVKRAGSLHIPLALFAYAFASFCPILRHFRNCETPTFALISTLFLNSQLQKVGSITGYWARTGTDQLLTLIQFLHISEIVKIRLLMSPLKRLSKRWLIRHLVHFLARVKHPVSGVYQRLEDKPGDSSYLSILPYQQRQRKQWSGFYGSRVMPELLGKQQLLLVISVYKDGGWRFGMKTAL